MYIKPLENLIQNTSLPRRVRRREVDQIPLEVEEPDSIIDVVDLSGHLGEEKQPRQENPDAQAPVSGKKENVHLDIEA